MGKGYAEGPAAEAAEEERDRRARGERPAAPRRLRLAVFGSTADDASPHFLGWRDEVDPDALFSAGTAYGITLRRIPG